MKRCTVVLSFVLVCCAFDAVDVFAADCSKVVSIQGLNGILYKPENLHGGRGPTLLVQNPYERTGKRRIEVRDLNCKLISSFGLYRTDWPYGARYYERSGGGKHTAKQLSLLAKKGGGASILVEGVQKWILIKNPLRREGEVFSG